MAIGGNWQSFEAMLKLECDRLAVRGIAKIEKVEPPTKTIRQGKFTKVIQLENPFLDFIGTWTECGARTVILEAKSTEEPRLPICVDNGLKVTQMGNLQRWAAAGAAVGILWDHKGDTRFVTLKQVVEARGELRASIQWADALRIQKGRGMYVPDFLAMLKVLDNAGLMV